MEPYSIYLHLPFCKSRCPYCDFASNDMAQIPFDAYINCLQAEYEHRKTVVTGQKLISVYLGGGTPSLWPVHRLSQLFSAMGLELNDSIEVTVEVNPGDTDMSWFAGVRALGVNRISVGVQATQDDRLRWLGRRHSFLDGVHAVQDARRAGIENVGVDFMYGTSGQTATSVADEVKQLLELNPSHVSAYELSISPHTRFGRMKSLVLPDSDAMAGLWQTINGILGAAGYECYEVCNYAKPGCRSRHNAHYWNGDIYLGLGSGAHGFIPGKARDQRIRYGNSSNLQDYMENLPSTKEGIGRDSFVETLVDIQLARERIMLGLRCSDGFDLQKVTQGLNASLQENWRKRFFELQSRGYVVCNETTITPTSAGMLMADELALDFF